MTKTYLELAQELIACQTVAGNTQAFDQAWQIVDSELVGYGKHVFRSNNIESRIYYFDESQDLEFDLILNLHLDVVSASGESFSPRIEGDKLIGRGAFDMKAAGAVEIALFRELASQLPYRLGLQITTDEELGGHNGVAYQFAQGLKAKFGLVGESGTNFGVKTKAKGINWYRVDFAGQRAHAAYPWKGVNPIVQLGQFVASLAKYFPTPESEVWETTVTPTRVVVDNNSQNQIPPQASLFLDVRFVPGEDEGVAEKIFELLPVGATLEPILSDGAMNTADDLPAVKQLLAVASKYGLGSKLIKSHGTGDMRFFSLNNVGAVEFGPVGAGDHGDFEWVSTRSLERFEVVLREWMLGFEL